MKVLFSRSSDIHIVEYMERCFLVNLKNGIVEESNPKNRPDMFLRFGYFDKPMEYKLDACKAAVALYLHDQEIKKFIK